MYRKPAVGMWKLYKRTFNKMARQSLAFELVEEADFWIGEGFDKSFFVGDAAGRRGDHTADDLGKPLLPIVSQYLREPRSQRLHAGFAKAAKLKFYTPEQFFGPAEPPCLTVRP